MVLILDFDGTLAPNTIDYFPEKNGADPERFKKEEVAPPEKQGRDSQLANFFALLQTAHRLNLRRKDFELLGEEFKPFGGVLQMFDRVRKTARTILPDMEVDFFLLTCGFLDLLRPMPIYKEFIKACGCELHFNEDDKPVFVKKAMSHPDKVRYILQIAKGLKEEDLELPSDVYQDIPEKAWYVPLDRVIYVWDGKSDMPAFSLLQEYNGIAIGVVNAKEIALWDGYQSMQTRRKVENLAQADYSENSELMEALLLGVESVSKRIKPRKPGEGE